jgi:hypothetical protein
VSGPAPVRIRAPGRRVARTPGGTVKKLLLLLIVVAIGAVVAKKVREA